MHYHYLKIGGLIDIPANRQYDEAVRIISEIESFLIECNITASVQVPTFDMLVFAFPEVTGAIAFKLRYSDQLWPESKVQERLKRSKAAIKEEDFALLHTARKTGAV